MNAGRQILLCTHISRILAEYGKKSEKKINLRVMVFIDPFARNPYEGINVVYAPGMVHLTTEKLAELMREFEAETERFLKGIILKDESRVPRTIYVSTNTRRIVFDEIDQIVKELDEVLSVQ